ncbi:hypothetical protein HMPREF1528_00079 [Capnocytophaga sp. oral taxon 336 str. F0502]|nr:hypothetical protein HMPREF1528_00079 [Capnocytophaga sp. oral taxon 336 str. F0502]
MLYNPNWEVTHKVLESIYKQVDTVFIVDNSPNAQEVDFSVYKNIVYHFIGGNKGIAAAQNIGINYFKQNKYAFIIFFDQDSIPPIDLVEHLYKKYKFLYEKRIKVGGIAPRPYNRREKKIYKGTIKKGKEVFPNITEVTEIISSASFIPIQNFEIVGNMEEDLFIDAVDFEWCWRATHRANFRFFICEDIFLSHQLGEKDLSIGVKKIAIHSPFRQYYRYRNFFKLLIRNYVPLYWKISNLIKYTFKYFYLPLCISPRKEYFYKINKGIYDGLLK